MGVTVILLAAAALIPFNSYYQRDFSASDLEIREEALQMTVLTEDDPPVLLAGVGEGYTGIVAETGGVTLQDGSRLCRFQREAEIILRFIIPEN